MKRIILGLSLLLVTVLYSAFLDYTPIHFNQDELGFSLNAYEVSKTGFDENGRLMPLYFWHLGVMWATPMIVYLTAAVLKLLPVSEVAIRLPSVIIGVTNIVFIYLLAKKIFKSSKYALLAAGLLALTPIHFIHSRILLDVLYPVPFVLGWILLLLRFHESKRPVFLLLAGMILGFGFYSYHAARIMMPFYLLVTGAYFFGEIRKNKRLFLILLSGFIVPLIPLVPWTLQYPDTLFADQVRYVGITSLFSLESLIHRFDVFISYFNPVYMFLLGDASLIHSTSLHHPLGLLQSSVHAGVFLLPLAIFIPLGIYTLAKRRNHFDLLILFGFLTAPIAGALAGDHWRYSRILVILPFAILLATYGIQFLLMQKRKILRVTCYVLLVASLLQFTYFFYDYFTGYRIRSYNWMKYNIPGALEEVIKEDSLESANVIYLDNRVEFIDKYWRFYLIKNSRKQLENKTEFIDVRSVDVNELSQNSIILYFYHNVDGQKEQNGEFKKIKTIREPDFVPTFYLFRN